MLLLEVRGRGSRVLFNGKTEATPGVGCPLLHTIHAGAVDYALWDTAEEIGFRAKRP